MSSSEGDDDHESSVDLSLLSEGGSDGEEEVAATGGAAAAAAQNGGSDGDGDELQQNELQPGVDGKTPKDGSAAATTPATKKKKKKLNKVLSKERLQRLQEKHARRGILYISRIPPHMKPAKLRQLLSQYGEVGRVYCTPEDASLRRKRKQHGGNTGACARFEAACARRMGGQGGGLSIGVIVGGAKEAARGFKHGCDSLRLDAMREPCTNTRTNHHQNKTMSR